MKISLGQAVSDWVGVKGADLELSEDANNLTNISHFTRLHSI